MKKQPFAIFLSVLLLVFTSPGALAEAYGSGWYQEVQLSSEHEDNVSRSYKDEDLVSDLITTLSYGGGHSRKLGTKGQLIVSGYATYNDYHEYDDLDHLALNGGLHWIHQPRNGYAAVWYGIDADATLLRYRDSEAREGVVFRFVANLNRRLTANLVGHSGYRYSDMVFLGKDKEEKDWDAAFDVAGHEIYLGADYHLARSIILFAEYGFRHGDITSTVSGGIDPSAKYDAETLDPAFDDCSDPRLCAVRYAYRSVADTHKLNIGIAFPVKQVNIDFSASYFDAEAENGKDYQNWMVKLGMVWNF